MTDSMRLLTVAELAAIVHEWFPDLRTGGPAEALIAAQDAKTASAMQVELDSAKELNESTYCAYCGEAFVLDDAAASKVTEHIYSCLKHPMRDVEAERDALREKGQALADALKGLDREHGEVDDLCFCSLPVWQNQHSIRCRAATAALQAWTTEEGR